MKSQVVFSRSSDEWETPDALFQALHAEFDFTLDGAATHDNAKCGHWLADAFSYVPFNERVWINPPYSKTTEFMAWIAQHRADNLFVVLVPSRTDTRWFHKYVWLERQHRCRRGVEVRFIKGRLKFYAAGQTLRTTTRSVVAGRHVPNSCAPFPSVLIVFRP